MASGLVCGWGVEKLVPELVPDTPGQRGHKALYWPRLLPRIWRKT